MENVWGTWTFFYIPAFLCGCAVGGASMLVLARKIIAKQAKQIAQAKGAGFCGGAISVTASARGVVAFDTRSHKRLALHRVS